MKKFFVMTFLLFVVILTKAQEEKYIGLFVYNFTKYFDWPSEAKSGDFKIQILGHQSVYDELILITAGKTVGNQKIVVQHINSIDEISAHNHILFLGHWQSRNIDAIKQKIANKPVLLVSEFEGLLEKGSIINFIVRDGKIKFELNSTNANASGLKMDPRLRELAYSITN
jgi:hypothetical protein